MLTQSFVSKVLDLKKSSSVFLLFFAFSLFHSTKIESVDSISVLELWSKKDIEEMVVSFALLKNIDSLNLPIPASSPLRKTPAFDGPPSNESNRSLYVQSPIEKRKPTFDGPPSNESMAPIFRPGPPSNE